MQVREGQSLVRSLPLARWWPLVLAGLALIVLAVQFLLVAPTPGAMAIFGDSTKYVSCARHLAAGDGVMIAEGGQLVPLPAQPPGYALALAPLVHQSPNPEGAIRWFQLGLLLVTAGLAGLVAYQLREQVRDAVAVVLVLAATHGVPRVYASILSEGLLSCLVLAGLACMAIHVRRDTDQRWVYWAALLLGLAGLVRVSAAPAIGALLATQVARRMGWRPLLATGAICTAPGLGWLLYGRLSGLQAGLMGRSLNVGHGFPFRFWESLRLVSPIHHGSELANWLGLALVALNLLSLSWIVIGLVKRRTSPEFWIVCLVSLYNLGHFLLHVASFTLFDPTNYFHDELRFHLPFYLNNAILVVFWLWQWPRAPRWRRWTWASLLVLAPPVLVATGVNWKRGDKLATQAKARRQSFLRLQELPPEAVIYSDDHRIHEYHARRPVLRLPRAWDHLSDRRLPVHARLAGIQEVARQRPVFMAYSHHSRRYVSPETLRQDFELEPVYQSPQLLLLRAQPRPGD